MGPKSNDKCLYKSESVGNQEKKKKGESNMKMEAEPGASGGHRPRSNTDRWSLWKLRLRQEMDFLPAPPTGARPCEHLDLGLWPPGLWENTFLWLSASMFVVIYYGSHGKQIQSPIGRSCFCLGQIIVWFWILCLDKHCKHHLIFFFFFTKGRNKNPDSY